MTNVNGIMSQENRTRNTAIGAGAGLAVGGGVGYLTKQVVKDGALTNDVFQKVVKEIEVPAEVVKQFAPIAEAEKALDAAKEALAKATKEGDADNVKKFVTALEKGEDLKEAFAALGEETSDLRKAAGELKDKTEALTSVKKQVVNRELKEGETLDGVIDAMRKNAEATYKNGIELAGNKSIKEALEAAAKAEGDKVLGAKKAVIEAFQKSGLKIEGVDEDAVKTALKEETKDVDGIFGQIKGAVEAGENSKKSLTEKISGLFQDNSKKLKDKFEEGSEKLGETVKKAMKSAKFKQAAIIGGITAAVLGLGAFLLSNKNADKANKQ